MATDLQIRQLEKLDQWHDHQQSLNSQILVALNAFSRDKYHKKPVLYEFEPSVILTLDDENTKLVRESTSDDRKAKKLKGTSFNSTSSTAEFQKCIDLLLKTANSKISFSHLLNESKPDS